MTTNLGPLALLAVLGLTVSGIQVLPGSDGGAGDAGRQTGAGRSVPKAAEGAKAQFARLPLRFELNAGQVHPEVKFVARGAGSNLFLTADEAVLALAAPVDPNDKGGHPAGVSSSSGPPPGDRPRSSQPDSVLRLSLVGAKPAAEVVGLERLPGHSNYLKGADPSQWRTNVAGYASVAYRNPYPGIDLVYHGRNDRLEYDFVVSPGADPGPIAVAFHGQRGLRLERDGSLVADMGTRRVRQPKPFAYQLVGDARRTVAASYRLGPDGRVGFSLGTYDRSRPLVIDPVIEYSTYLGGTAHDFGRAVAVDAAGSAYVVGNTMSANFPTRGSLQPYAGKPDAYNPLWGGDAFVAKLDPSGTNLVYATYLGGNQDDGADDVAIDPTGHAYVTGGTRSADFPTTSGALQRTASGCNQAFAGAYPCDVFITKLAPSGAGLVYSTLLGGKDGDKPGGIAVGPDGKAYLAGSTASWDFPVTDGALDTKCGFTGDCDKVNHPAWDAYVSVLDAAGSALVYSTFLGGPPTHSSGDDERANDIAVDAGGHIFVTGFTQSALFPTTAGARQGTCGFCQGDAFVSRIDPVGNGPLDLVYSTYLGGKLSWQGAESISVWSDESVGQSYAYVAGWTDASDFPTTPNAFQPRKVDPFHLEGFMTRFVTTNPGFAPPDYSTYLGGVGYDVTYGMAVDHAGAAHLTGETSSDTFPTTPDAFLRSKNSGGSGGFFTKIAPAFAGPLSLVYSTFLSDGDAWYEAGQGVAVDAAGNPFVTGYTSNFGFPVSGDAFQQKLNAVVGDECCPPDAFVMKLNFSGVFRNYSDLAVALSDTPDPVGVGQDLTYAISVTNTGPDAADNVVVFDQLPRGVTYKSSLGNCSHSAGAVTCSLGRLAKGDSFHPSITVTPFETGSLTNTVSVRTSSEDPDAANNTASTSTTVRPAADLALSITDSPDPVVVRQPLTYTLGIANKGPSGATGVVVTQLLPAGVDFVSASTTQGSCTRSKQKVTCSIGGLARDGGATVTVLVKPGDKGTIATSAEVVGNEIDPQTLNNKATASTTVT